MKFSFNQLIDSTIDEIQFMLAKAYEFGVEDGMERAIAMMRHHMNGAPYPEPLENPFLKKDE